MAKTIQIQKSTATREKIFEESFRLFISKPYELVSIRDIEKAIGKTRGAVFYHVKDKHELFERVIDKYFTKSQNIYYVIGEDILEKNLTLLEFIEAYIAAHEKKINELYAFAEIEKDKMDRKGTARVESSYLSLLLNTGYYLEDYNDRMDQNFKMDRNTWAFFITKAIERGEIKPNTNVKLFGEIFSSIFIGKSFQDSLTKGVNMKDVRELFLEIYNRIKA